jgi:hypothetical protein
MTRVNIVTTPHPDVYGVAPPKLGRGAYDLCVGLILLMSVTLFAVPQQHRGVGSRARDGHARPLKRTWTSGPATLPPETEMVPSRPPASPPRAVATLGPSTQKTNLAARKSQLATSQLVKSVPAPAEGQGSKSTSDQPEAARSAGSEAGRVQAEFTRLRDDAAARRAFYDDLLGTVERERSRLQETGSPEDKPVTSEHAGHPNPTQPPPTSVPAQPVPAKAAGPQSFLEPNGNRADPAAHWRVVARAEPNGTHG